MTISNSTFQTINADQPVQSTHKTPNPARTYAEAAKTDVNQRIEERLTNKIQTLYTEAVTAIMTATESLAPCIKKALTEDTDFADGAGAPVTMRQALLNPSRSSYEK